MLGRKPLDYSSPNFRAPPSVHIIALKDVGEWCPAAGRPREERATGAVHWSSCKNSSWGRGGVGKGGARPL